MRKILLPMDGSESALRALAELIKRWQTEPELDIYLLNVQMPVESGHARLFVSPQDISQYHQEEGQAALKSARERLEQAGVRYQQHIVVGHVAKTINEFAQQHGFDEIVMGTHGRGALLHLLLGSVASDVIRAATLPVTLVR